MSEAGNRGVIEVLLNLYELVHGWAYARDRAQTTGRRRSTLMRAHTLSGKMEPPGGRRQRRRTARTQAAVSPAVQGRLDFSVFLDFTS